MSDSIYLVYKHTCPEGKSYIGITDNYEQRCESHQQFTSGCPAFNAAILKHGWSHFTHEILLSGLTLMEALYIEVLMIRHHNTRLPNGYNMSPGGGNIFDNDYPQDEQRELYEAARADLAKIQAILRPPESVKKKKKPAKKKVLSWQLAMDKMSDEPVSTARNATGRKHHNRLIDRIMRG